MTPDSTARRAPRTALTAALAALLAAAVTGCGIGPGDPAPAGAPASGVQRSAGAFPSARLYFASPYGIRAVVRPTDGAPSPQQALDLLLKGPTPAERERGLTSQVPPAHGQLTASAGDGAVDVFVPFAVSAGDLDVTAISQLACTAAHAEVPGGLPATQVDVRIHENFSHSGDPWTVRCGSHGNVTPVAR
ncbi:hypothetical protein [Streptomyces sediminimaris]|uniref:hypothetical protein n=1 Tax=Streptomyces sediminimaris TaxID=3383721 RepID=UPI00399A3824